MDMHTAGDCAAIPADVEDELFRIVDSARLGRDGVGLHSMRERAQRVGAALTVASEQGSGTQVLVYWSAAPS